MTRWTTDGPLVREGGWQDDEEPIRGGADWGVWLKTHAERDDGGVTCLKVQFAREGIDRAKAETIVSRILFGLNEGASV